MYGTLSSSLSAAFSSGSATSSHQWEELSPHPVPENLCELRGIVADISRTVDQSPFVSVQIKASLRDCNHTLEVECTNLQHLTQLAHRAARDASYVLRWRVRFFDALHDRILELSRLRAAFVGSRRAFHEQVSNLLTGEIRNAKGRVHDGMLSGLKSPFDRIDRYYHEVDVSLHTEEKCLKKIHSSLRVTSDDKRRWEHIRDACKEAFNLLTTRAPLPPPHMPQPMPKNKAARNIEVLAQTVSEARQSLLQAHQGITDLTQHPQFGLLRLQSEYQNGEKMCQETIGEVLRFSEHFLRSFVEIPPLDDFREHVLPSAAESSSRILQGVYGQMRSNARAVLSVLPQLKSHFARFDHCLPIADASMRGMYSTLRRLVQPLQQPDDPPQGVFRTMRPVQLRDEQSNWSDLERQWAAQLHL